MKHITINFGLVASKKFPDVAQQRVLTTGSYDLRSSGTITYVALDVLDRLLSVGCDTPRWDIKGSTTEPTLVVELMYPYEAEQLDCAPPSVLKYEPYMRLYEVACFFAQDCVAVLPEGEEGLLVGANCRDWGVFDSNKFITLD